MARKSRYETIAENGTALSGAAFIAGLYLRLSVEDGDDLENNSIGNQRKIGLDFLRSRTDIALGGIYIDNGRTGMNFKRSGFQSMLSDLEDGKINCVIVKDVSRLGRHYVMTSEYVEKVFPTMGVRLICVNDPYDSADPRADRDSLLMPFKLIMNDTYVKDTARKIQSSINAKIRNGAYLPAAGSIPYGYLRNPEEITYAVDPEAAAVVGRIFEMRAVGMMFNAIAKQLNEEGIPCPGKLRYERGATRMETYKDALWLRGTIRKITGDMVYTGCRIHGKIKRERLGGDKKRRPPEDWKIFENAHPAIVSKELFEKVQAVNQAELARRGAFEKRDGPGPDFRGIFAGKVFCGDCGARMSAGKRVQRAASSLPNTFFFDCNSYRYSNHQRCASHYIGQETLMNSLRHLLDKQVETAVDVERLLNEVRKRPAPNSGNPDDLPLSLRNRRFHLEEKLERLLEDVTAGVLNREEYLRLKTMYVEEQARIEARENEVEQQREARQKALETTEAWLKAIQDYCRVPVIDRALVDALVEKILVYDDKSIRICLTYSDPYAPLASYLKDAEGGAERAG